jgi:hypothetical protein
MRWDVDIVHQNNTHLTDVDNWSQLGKDICFDPHLCKYLLQLDCSLRAEFSAPKTLPMLPQNMPYYCGLRIPSQANSSVEDADTASCQALISTITGGNGKGLTHLSHVPVWFGDYDTVTPAYAHVSTNHKIPSLAQKILQFSWAV